MMQIKQEEFESFVQDDFDQERGEYDYLQISPALNGSWGGLYLAVKEGQVNKLKKILLPEDPMFFCYSLDDLAGNFPGFKNDPASDHFLQIYCASDRCYYGYANMYRKLKELAVFLEDCRFAIVENHSYWLDEYRIDNGVLRFHRTLYDTSHLDNDLFLRKAIGEPEDGQLCYAVANDMLFSLQHDLESGNKLEIEDGDIPDDALKICPESDNAWFFKGLYDLMRTRNTSARECFENTAKWASGSFYAAVGSVMTSMLEGSWQHCLVHVDKALSRNESGELLLIKGYAFSMLELPELSKNVFRNIWESKAKPEFSIETLNILRHGGMLDKIVDCFFNAARKEASDYPVVLEIIGEVLLQLMVKLDSLSTEHPELLHWLIEKGILESEDDQKIIH